jgi:hypothetical protein
MIYAIFSIGEPDGDSALLIYELRLATSLPYEDRKFLAHRLFLEMHPRDKAAIIEIPNPSAVQRFISFCSATKIVVEPLDAEAAE